MADPVHLGLSLLVFLLTLAPVTTTVYMMLGAWFAGGMVFA